MTRALARRDDRQGASDRHKPLDANERTNTGDPPLSYVTAIENVYALHGFDSRSGIAPRTFGLRGLSSRPTRGRVADVAFAPSVAERLQAEYFKAILAEQHAQIVREIGVDSSALAQCADSGDMRGIRRLLRGLARKHREEFELDRLRQGLHRRFGVKTLEQAKEIRYYDVVITNRLSCWHVQIPELDVALTNIHRRGDAEILGRAYIAAITGTPMAGIAVSVVPTRPLHGRREGS